MDTHDRPTHQNPVTPPGPEGPVKCLYGHLTGTKSGGDKIAGLIDKTHVLKFSAVTRSKGDKLLDRPFNQKTIGILGGCSNVATAEYYRFLNDGVNARLGGWDIAETLITGMNFGNIEAFVRQGEWAALEAYMRVKINGLVDGGADVVLCVSNTLHKSLETVMDGFAVPLIHIADPTGRAINQAGLKRVALFGTRPVMQMSYLKDRYSDRFDIETITPTDSEQEDIDRIIFDELVKGVLTKQSKARYIEIADRMRREDLAEGLILGCTEIFLLIAQADMPDFLMFNTAKLHCDAAIKFALSEK